MKGRFDIFTVLVAKVSRSIRRIKIEEMDEFELKSPHVTCLYYLHKFGSLTATEIVEIAQEDKSALSRSLDYLENNGYIVCDSQQKKRYKNAFTLTDKGKNVAKTIAKKIDSILEKAGEGLTEEKRLIFYESFALISDNLEKICNNYKGEKYEN